MAFNTIGYVVESQNIKNSSFAKEKTLDKMCQCLEVGEYIRLHHQSA